MAFLALLAGAGATGLGAQVGGPPEIERGRAAALFQNGKLAEAREIYRRLVGLFENDFEFNRSAGLCLLTGSSVDMELAARSLARAYHLNREDREVEFSLAKALTRTKHYAAAVALFRRILAREPGNSDARLELARVLAWSARYAEAVEEYERVLDLAPANLEAWLGLARVWSWSREYPQALAAYARVLALEPSNHEARIERARLYAWMGEYARALALYDELLIADPQARDALLGKAQVLAWRGRFREAHAILKRLGSEHPEDAEVVLALAATESGLGRNDLALRRLDAVEQTEPENPDARRLRANIRKQLRPEFVLGIHSAVQSDDLKIYSYAARLSFSPKPTVRAYLAGNIFVSNFPRSGMAQAREILFGGTWQATHSLRLRGNIGMNSGSARALLVQRDSAGSISLVQGESETREGLIGGAGVTWNPSDTMRFDFDFNRRFLNYIPRSIQLNIRFLELRSNWEYNPRPLRLHAEYFHTRFSDSNRQNGANLAASWQLLRSESLNIEAGYLFSGYTFSLDPFVQAASSGFFAPRHFERHAATTTINGRLAGWLGYSVEASLGAERFPQRLVTLAAGPVASFDLSRFRSDGNLRVSAGFALNSRTELSLGYSYARLAGLTQPSALAAEIFSAHGGHASLLIRF